METSKTIISLLKLLGFYRGGNRKRLMVGMGKLRPDYVAYHYIFINGRGTKVVFPESYEPTLDAP